MDEEQTDPLPERRPAPPPIPRPVLPLDYSAAEKSPKPRGPLIGRMLLGFFGYLSLSVGWFALATQARIDQGVVMGAWFVGTLVLLGLALYLRLRYRIAGYGYGILMVFGLAALLVVGGILLLLGLCFSGKIK